MRNECGADIFDRKHKNSQTIRQLQLDKRPDRHRLKLHCQNVMQYILCVCVWWVYQCLSNSFNYFVFVHSFVHLLNVWFMEFSMSFAHAWIHFTESTHTLTATCLAHFNRKTRCDCRAKLGGISAIVKISNKYANTCTHHASPERTWIFNEHKIELCGIFDKAHLSISIPTKLLQLLAAVKLNLYICICWI